MTVKLPLMMLMRAVAALPGGGASVPEVVTGSVAASTTGTFNLSTTLVSSDVVVVVTSRTTLAIITPGGLGGATFTNVFSQAANARVLAHTATGVTGSGHSVTVTASTDVMGVAVYVVRGLASATCVEQHSVWSSANTTANTDEFTPSQSYNTGQVAIMIGSGLAAGTVTMPSNPTPSSGWTSDLARTASPRLYTAHHIASGSGTVVGGIRNSSTVALGVAVLVLG